MTNTGDRRGGEVVQVYVGAQTPSVARPVRELKSFAKVFLEPGESSNATLPLDARSFAHWSTLRHDWVVEAGAYEIAVGSSSRDLPLRSVITVDAPSIAAPLSADSTLHEWLADPQGRALLDELDVVLLHDPELVKVVGTMPMRTLASFEGMVVDHDALDQLVTQLH